MFGSDSRVDPLGLHLVRGSKSPLMVPRFFSSVLLFHHRENTGIKDHHVNGRANPANNMCGDRFHHVGAKPGFRGIGSWLARTAMTVIA